MPFDRDNPLRVRAEAISEPPELWAWAIYRGDDHTLILRSQAEYPEQVEALHAGLKAAAGVGRRLRVEVVADDAELLRRKRA